VQRELSGQESRCGIVVFMCDGDGVVEGVWMVELGILDPDLNEMSVCIYDMCEFKRCCVCLSCFEGRLSWKEVLGSELWIN
jgi:hypothetical protein